MLPLVFPQAALRHQQQRLLLLRHASKCPTKDGECKVTPHCAAIKRLWQHIADCKNQHCSVTHCVTTRFVFSHYHRCKDMNCYICAPVRDLLAKAHQRQLIEIRRGGAFTVDRFIQVRFQRKANGVRWFLTFYSLYLTIPCLLHALSLACRVFFQARYSEADEILRKAIQKYQTKRGWNRADACRWLLDRARFLEPQVRAD